MKKRKIILGVLILLLCNLFVLRANAISVSYTGNKAQLPKAGGGTYGMKLYRANINGKSLMTYCLDAGRTYSGDGDYNVEHVVDPYKSQNTSWYKFDVAATYAYQYMVQNGFATTTEDNNIIGELVFRWITEAYASAGCGPTCGATLSPAYNLFRKLTVGFNHNDSRVATAVKIYDLAATLAEKNLPYDQLIANGYDNNGGGLWGVSWEVTTLTNSPLNSEQNQLRIEMRPANGIDLDRIDFSQFSVYFTNESVKNNIVSQSAAQVSGDTVAITVMFNKGTWDGKDVGAVVRAYFCDSMDASTQLYLLKRANGYQRMLTVLPGEGTCRDRDDNPHSGPRDYPIRESNCSCDTTTGEYIYRRYKDGSLVEEVKWYETDANSEANKTKYNCPATCSKRENSCLKPSESTDGKYHCPDSPNSDGSCSEEEYNKQCTHTCQTPEESGDGKYYCKESSPGAGDGKECSETEYKAQCLNINCTPNVTMPSDCNDFDIEGTEKGSIGDINKTPNSCNQTANQIKQCVINNDDITGASFETTTEINNNPYCKIWCEETFDFTLPTAKLSESGGYFTIETKVSGTRSCYVSGADDPANGIDATKFNADLKAAQQAVITAWNEYNHWKVAASIDSTVTPTSDTHAAHSYECDCDTDPTTNTTTCSTCECSGVSRSTTVYSKNWTYKVYTLQGAPYEASDSYVSGTAASCQHNYCTGESGTNQDSEHKTKRDNAKANLIQKINELNSIIIQYNNCTGAMSNGMISDLITTAANSTGWDNDFNFNPTVTYNYNQDYIEKMNGTMKKVSSDNMNSSYEYCTVDVDGQYNCPGSSKSSTVPDETISILSCNDDNCNPINIKISKAKWIKKTKKETATYKPSNNFSTYTQYGTIKFDKGNSYLYTKLPEDALPISLITQSGVFPFAVNYGNIGQSNSDNTKLGRLIGQTTSVLTEYNKLPASLTCKDKDETMEQNIGYVCHYLNNCKGDCDFKCDDDNNCEFDGDNCEDGVCKLICENCIFDGDKNTYSYRTVSLNKLFPNERDDYSGYNWNTSIKGQITQREIESNSDTIYEEPEYSFTLTPNNLKNIRDYNDEVGSYTNTKTNDNEDSLRCSIKTINGVDYPVKCTSTFLDMLEGLANENYNFARYKNKYAQSDVAIRPEYEQRFVLADQLTDSNGKLICQNFSCVSRTDYIGPAWK